MSKIHGGLLGAALVMAASLTAGCATTAQVEQAQATADEAKRLAMDAQSAASRAQSCCDDTNAKLDRMFKRSMYK